MQKILNPLTGELIDNNVKALSAADIELKNLESAIASTRQVVRDALFELLLKQPNEVFENDKFEAKIVRPTGTKFNLDAILDLLGDVRSYTDPKGNKIDLYKPSAGAIRDYIAQRIKNQELTEQEAQKYRESFEEVAGTAYPLVTSKKDGI